MKTRSILLGLALGLGIACQGLAAGEFQRIAVRDYRDKMKAGWIGQIAGVAWGAPTEFKWKDAIIPEDKMPQWRPEMINNAFGQDDLGALVQPFPTVDRRQDFSLLPGQGLGRLMCRHDKNVELHGFSVPSNLVDFIHGEQMIDHPALRSAQLLAGPQAIPADPRSDDPSSQTRSDPAAPAHHVRLRDHQQQPVSPRTTPASAKPLSSPGAGRTATPRSPSTPIANMVASPSAKQPPTPRRSSLPTGGRHAPRAMTR